MVHQNIYLVLERHMEIPYKYRALICPRLSYKSLRKAIRYVEILESRLRKSGHTDLDIERIFLVGREDLFH